MSVTTPTIADLTQAKVDGVGVFDVLMRANKVHLEQEFKLGRIKGPEYSTVYLGSLQSVLQSALTFLLEKDKNALQAQLIEQQILLAQVEVQKAQAELAIINATLPKIAAEILLVNAQVAVAEQQALNLAAEAENVPKQGAVLDAEAAKIAQQTTNLAAEELNIPKQGVVLTNQAAHIAQQTTNLVSEELLTDARTALTTLQTANAVIEGKVLVAQECKLRAEYDLLVNQNSKVSQETALLQQKVITEQAQTQAIGVDPDSVIGKQKALYTAQTDGFKRDSEQKAAKVLVDTWNTRRVTDEGTVADGVNMLNDATIGRAINKLLAGVGA